MTSKTLALTTSSTSPSSRPWTPEEETWGREIAVLPTPEDALHLAERDLAADPQRWVNQGIVCDEYQDFRKMNP
ncbi:hypothetical protein ACFC1L_44095 [Streptomyces sp. NPDC056210]|uniref:hypothetical protein n=1 Tax=Streptomyces sp. NPDC056210 TaxID=3345746 RepID=UPI0035D6F70D